jgi:hypothetical protein
MHVVRLGQHRIDHEHGVVGALDLFHDYFASGAHRGASVAEGRLAALPELAVAVAAVDAELQLAPAWRRA